jgi:hypothetical protein
MLDRHGETQHVFERSLERPRVGILLDPPPLAALGAVGVLGVGDRLDVTNRQSLLDDAFGERLRVADDEDRARVTGRDLPLDEHRLNT